MQIMVSFCFLNPLRSVRGREGPRLARSSGFSQVSGVSPSRAHQALLPWARWERPSSPGSCGLVRGQTTHTGSGVRTAAAPQCLGSHHSFGGSWFASQQLIVSRREMITCSCA